ncbi:LysR family transcriptional regulator [Sporosarcina jeotgali]|uniref:LysR family transcriptional regulator n=1 Tax=Sporosarcina jeotgali TaxID=3020056 RepID=A0ABZ0KZR3_9BACL|nr:LysR family transcriptional regulator [Sporosarcina sp. B2O-1]WOV85123.1 LysR family transcriptional regulator [Sporosarcina sp. B2O-1]
MNTTEIMKVLAEEGNMRKAADRLFISQPALSQRLQSIEKAWGAKLFVRSQKGLVPTAAGELVIEFAKETVQRKEETMEQIAGLADRVHGTLKIACASIVGQTWLPEVLKDYVKHYPDAKISLMTGWTSEILKALYEGEAHVGIVRGEVEWNSRRTYLFRDQLYLVDKEITSLEQLKDTERPYIQFKSDSNYYTEIQQWWQKHFSKNPGRQLTVDQMETCRQLVLNGIGYAILPSITLRGDEQVNKIPLLNSEAEFELTRDTYLIGYESSFELKQVDAFSKVIEAHAQELKKDSRLLE